VFLLLWSPWLRLLVAVTIMTSTGPASCNVATQFETCELERNGSWCTRVTSREYLKTKESVAGNLGTTTGHAILGEHMWASDKALGAEGTPRL
jgi:hypothetical protein